MTVSESGIEAALAPCPFCGGPVRLTQSKTLGDRLFVIECERNSPCFGSGLGNYVVASQKAEAIAAWNRRHPPASREEGLSDALTKVRDAILSPINSSAIVDTVWMPVPGATFSIETLVDFIDAALQSKKPE